MPWGSVRLMPGVNTERTPALLETGYSASVNIRFRDGLAEKLGGWQKFAPFGASGIPRQLHAWQDLNITNHLACGTTSQLGVITAGALLDITPQILTSNFAPTNNQATNGIFTTAGSPIVNIVDPNIANVTTFDAVFFATAIYVGGLVLAGLYPIAAITGTTSYNITASRNATATVGGGAGTPAFPPNFTTASGSAIVTVEIDNSNLAVGNQVVFPFATTGNGVTIAGTYTVISVTDASHFQIVVANQANASSSFLMNAGQARIIYYINLAPPAAGTGFGLGGFGAGGFGTGVVPASQTGTPIAATDWTLGNFGEILIACPHGGGIYQYDPTSGFQNAGLISGAPLFNAGIFILMPQQQIMAYGSTIQQAIGLQQDPMEARWCDVGNFNQWTASSANQAGSFRLSPGNAIVGGLQAAQQALLWTDLDIWSVSYLGAPLVWGFNKIAGGAGLIGPRARCELGGEVFWMTSSNFYVLGGGGPAVLPCSVWDAVFQNLDPNPANQAKAWAWADSPFNEAWFFWPSGSGGLGECDSYAKFNKVEKTWDVNVGGLSRTCGIDQSVLGRPISASRQALIYQHETTQDADGAPLAWSFTTGYFMIGEGEDYYFVDLVIPDFRFGLFNGSSQNAQVQMSFNLADDPGGAVQTVGPFTVTATTPQLTDLRLRAKLMSFTIGGNDQGSFARLGRVRYRYRPDGRHA